MKDVILGAWTLRSFTVANMDTGERSEPFGPAPRGIIMFSPEGRMAAMLTPGSRAVPTTEADRAAAFGQLVAYSGRYRLEPPDRFVTEVDVAWFEPWVGSEQARTFKLDGDRLDIMTAPGPMPQPDGSSATVVATLSWLREVSR